MPIHKTKSSSPRSAMGTAMSAKGVRGKSAAKRKTPIRGKSAAAKGSRATGTAKRKMKGY